MAERATRYCGYVPSVSIILAAWSTTSSALQVTSTAEYIWYQYNSDCPSYNIRTQRTGVKRQCTLTYIYERSMLNANVSVPPRTLCLHDERNARKNCEVKTSRLVCEQPLTSTFPCVDSIRFILSALNSAHDTPLESTHLSPT